MPNNHSTGDLFTGMHSRQAREVQAQREERRNSRKEAQVELGEDATDILKIIKDERAQLPKALWKAVNIVDTDESMTAKKDALLLYDKYLVTLHNRVATLTKKPIISIEDIVRSSNE